MGIIQKTNELVLEKVRKRNGIIVSFDESKVVAAVQKAFSNTGEGDEHSATKVARAISEKLIEKFVTNGVGPVIPGVEEIQDLVEQTLMELDFPKTAKHYILYREQHKQLRDMRTAIVGKPTELKISPNALRVLKERYLLKDNEGKVIESPEQMFRRVAKNVSQADKLYASSPSDVQKTEDIFYEFMTDLRFVPNSPTLYNAGTPLQQLSACFVLPIEDNLTSIYTTLMNQAIIHASGGGTGFSFSRLRPKGSIVQSTKGIASGPVSFMKVYNASTQEIKQGGKRRGANMGILRVDHPDIVDFIHCKTQQGEITNFNISVAITDAFMEAVKKGEDYDLIDPKNGKTIRTESAKRIWELLVSSAWVAGDPGVIFIDRVNRDNPTPKIGAIESTNPCGEVPLLPYESCNLGSLVLSKFVENGNILWSDLKQDIHTAVHFLDNVVDMNNYPIKEIEDMTKNGNRKIGLGVMGWAEMLYKMNIAYDSEEAIDLGEKVIQFIREEADKASIGLAKVRGPFPHWNQSVFFPNGPKFRNATRLSIAPTGSISMIAEASSGVEPVFALSYIKRVMDGQELLYTNEVFKQASMDRAFYSESLMEKIANLGSIQHVEEIPEDVRRVFVVAHDISPYWHTRMQAVFQKHVDLAISKTVNFPHTATIQDVEEVYLLAYDLGCKGVTIYRDGSREGQVLNLTMTDDKGNIKTNEPGKASAARETEALAKAKGVCPNCGNQLVMQEGCATCPHCSTGFCAV